MTMRGMTLIETVMTIAILAALTLVLASLVFRFDRLLGYQSASGASASSGNLALGDLTSDLSSADHVLASHPFSDGTRVSSANALVLELPAVAGSGAYIPGSYDYIAYYLTGANLYREASAAAGSVRQSGTKRLSNLVTALSFSYDDTDFTKVANVSATLSTGTTTQEGAAAGGGTIRARLRNF